MVGVRSVTASDEGEGLCSDTRGHSSRAVGDTHTYMEHTDDGPADAPSAASVTEVSVPSDDTEQGVAGTWSSVTNSISQALESPIIKQSLDSIRRMPNTMFQGDSSSPKPAVKLSMRKVSLGGTTPGEGGHRSSSNNGSTSAGDTQGLPTLLKKMRVEAQDEIRRATATVTQLHDCLAREILHLEQQV